jgi:hypothetical protein
LSQTAAPSAFRTTPGSSAPRKAAGGGLEIVRVFERQGLELAAVLLDDLGARGFS